MEDRYTLADLALYAYTHVAEEGGFELAPYPAVRAWLARVRAEPGHVTIHWKPQSTDWKPQPTDWKPQPAELEEPA